MSRDLSHIKLIPDVQKTCGPVDMGMYAILFNSNHISRNDAIACVRADKYSPYVLCIPMQQLNGLFYDEPPTKN